METTRKKVSFYTLGCKLNFAETSTISRSFPEDQFEKVKNGTKADIYVINTCSVTGAADRKCRQIIKRCINISPDAVIAVIGCYSQLNPAEIASIPGVDLILGTHDKFDAAVFLRKFDKQNKAEIITTDLTSPEVFHPSFSVGDRTRSFLKVQDGCDYKCSYCTIPLARGESRNQDIQSLIREAELIAQKGIKEIVITGVNIGDFGKSTGDTFASLLKKLVNVEGIKRYRISSIEPNLLTDEIINLVAESGKILPHFHIPLQSGSDKVLRLMRRKYERINFEDRVRTIKKILPHAGIGADIITGFPGESDIDFEDTFTFLEDMPLSYLHVFNYSERPGTPAVKMQGKVPVATREKRSRRLINLSGKKHLAFARNNIGQTDDILFEHMQIEGMITGFTGNYLRSEYPWEPSLAGKIKKAKMTGISMSGRMTIELID